MGDPDTTMNTGAAAGLSLEYREGWYAEEHDGTRPFRWMGHEARCRLTGLGSSRNGWVRITGGLWRACTAVPELSVSVNGTPVGHAAISLDIAHRVFPIEVTDPLEIALVLDRTFSVPGDSRTLGMMVRAIDVFLAEDATVPLDAEGWHEWERHEYFPFRWMGREARLIVPARLRQRGRFAGLPVLAPGDTGGQVLTVSGDGRVIARLPLRHGWHIYDLDLADGQPAAADEPASVALSFSLDHLAPDAWRATDPRELGVVVGGLDVHDDRRRHEYVCRFHREAERDHPADDALGGATARASAPEADEVRNLPIDGDGWHGLESGEEGPFRWMKLEGRLRIAPSVRRGRFCVIPIFSAFRNLTQELTILADGQVLASFPLMKARNNYNLALPDASGDLVLTLRINKLTPAASHPTDPRDLGIRIGSLRFHDDEARQDRERFIQENLACSQGELQQGAAVLTSFPSTLGVDLYGKCNIKPACVYCLWDRMKALEGANVTAVIDDRTLESYGPMFRSVQTIVNCSFGEPLLHPRLEQILDSIERHGKTVELSSNGQAFTARTVRALSGRPVHLYVSLDAASAETYARLRNDEWDEILTGLLFLREARQRGGGWPTLNMVFMPMRANRHDLEAYFKLCRLVAADALVLRPLLSLEDPDIVTERGGYRFDYERELLGRDELEAIFVDAGRFADQYDVNVRSQFDFGKIDPPNVRSRWRANH